jgi:hypothetical protein
MTNKEFNDNYLVSKGYHPDSSNDVAAEILTYFIKKGHFEYSFKNVLKSLEIYVDEVLGNPVHIFSRFYKTIPVYSGYDCTGQLCGYHQSINIMQTEYEWIVVKQTTSCYDY